MSSEPIDNHIEPLTQGENQSTPLPRRRVRPPISCMPCRRRKVKCNRHLPCNQCDRLGRASRCVYSEERNRNFEWSSEQYSLPTPSSRLALDEAQARVANTGVNHMAPPEVAADSRRTSPTHQHQTPVNPVLLSVMTHPAEHSQGWHVQYSSYGGRSHWSWILPRFFGLLQYVEQAGFLDHHQNHISYKDAKAKMKIFQISDPKRLADLDLMLSELPAKESVDLFIEIYFGTFERMWRILDIHSFFGDLVIFWQSPGAVSPDITIQIFLVILIGNSLVNPGQSKLPFETSLNFWRTALSWRSAAVLVQDTDLRSIQTDALLLLTKRIYRFDNPVSAITSVSLVRNGMLLGLHREPSLFKHFSSGEAELRRRLWYTILEIDLISSIDSGVPPSIEPDSWDTSYPSVTKDDELNVTDTDHTARLFREKVGTGAIGLVALAKSISHRMKIVKMINQINLSLPYEEVLRLGSELRMEQKLFHDRFLNSELFTQQNDYYGIVHELGDLLFERMIFLLHKPFAIEFRSQYEFSEYICLKTAFNMLEKLCLCPQPDFAQGLGNPRAALLSPLAETGGFFFESDALNAALLICLFVIRYAKSNESTFPIGCPPTQKASIKQLQNFLDLARRRLRLPYPSGKAFIIPSMTLEYLALVNATDLADPELPTKLRRAGDEVARTTLTLYLERPGSVTNHITDSEAIVETTSFLF